MKGLIIKDLLNLRKYGKTVFAIILFYMMLIMLMDDARTMSGMIVLIAAVTSITSFSYDQQCGWDVYALTMPVSRKDVVLSKYVLSILLALGGGVLSILAGWMHGILKKSGNFADTLVYSYVLFAIAVLFICILLPLVFKLGVERSRILLLAVVAVPTAALMLLANSGLVGEPNPDLLTGILAFSPAGLVLCIVVSFVISNAIYRRKEV